MSSWDGTDEDRTRRLGPSDDDRTRRLGGDAGPGGGADDATRRMPGGQEGPAGTPGATPGSSPAGGEGAGIDDTRHLPPEGDTTEREPRILAYEQETWEEEPPAQPTAAAGPQGPDDEEVEPRSKGREAIIGLAGAIIGFILAFVVVALGTGGSPDDGQATAAEERIAALEEELGERDAQLAEREAELAERDAAITELETRVADAEAAAGEGAAALESQRQALDQRAAALDERAAALDARETALEEREAELGQAPPPDPGDAPAGEEPGAEQPGDGILPDDLPQIDGETAETIVERVIERIRELLPGG